MDSWGQGLALVLIAVFLEAVVDVLMDTFKVRFSRRHGEKDKRSHH